MKNEKATGGIISSSNKKSKFFKTLIGISRHWQLYILLLFPVIWTFLFRYYPMYGVQIAFRDFNPGLGILQSKWVGLKYFKMFLTSPQFKQLLINTFAISIYSILASAPIPIILAVALNECKIRPFAKTVQIVTYAPYFISTVILVAMVNQVLSPIGLLNNVIKLFGGEAVNLLAKPKLFRSIYVWSGIWQSAGYSSVIYLAALSGINKELYEAARIDGASTLQKIMYIDLPGIMPTFIILLILNSASVLNVGYEKIYLMQNPLNLSVSEVISTYVYKIGLTSAQYSYSSAIGLFNSVVSMVMMTLVNFIAKKTSETSLW
ncbi:MAG: sugar ABC transporter permease [Clostridiaceae bacterium]|nr:sugar ABC transporter permease [Clostridiaceae bacterium]